MIRIAALFAVLGLTACVGGGAPPPADPPLELERYKGLWYEAARTPNSFEDNTPTRDGVRLSACFNSTATYTIETPERIGVTNVCQRRAPDGSVVSDAVVGSGEVIEGSGGRRLSVAFGSAFAQFFQRLIFGAQGNYWIERLGPVNADGLYDWSVVAGPSGDMVFILTRQKSPPRDVRDAYLSAARAEGLPVEALIFTQE